jgi:hypothetical protein
LNHSRARPGIPESQVSRNGITALRDRFTEEAAAFGVTIEEVFGITKRKPGRPRKADTDAPITESREIA